ncbi:tyrosine-type recombinase/integrase [Streptomyces griseoaurantiacus]|uniref:Phage integrase family protein n=1 Tax=Streptomyces griseoaurantiacus TaxID=68213 RepID=A0A1G7F5H3_9ACTN|nr:tyrosine-type recombinase/integrase [Streptomyces jietaisiensis]SDE71174.1 Phage integrase family protein [Streptomyces jietaisiensis]
MVHGVQVERATVRTTWTPWAASARLCLGRRWTGWEPTTLDRLVKRAGVRRITVRLARHTCGTLLAFLKVRPKVAQAILRHSQISMTMDVYTHVVGDSEQEAVGMLAELLEDPLIG